MQLECSNVVCMKQVQKTKKANERKMTKESKVNENIAHVSSIEYRQNLKAVNFQLCLSLLILVQVKCC